MWLKIVSGLCLPLGIGIGIFTKNIFCAITNINEKIMTKSMQSIQNGNVIKINIPTLFWFGITIPIWILSIWIISEKIYYRKNDLVMNLIQSCITIFQDKSLSKWFQNLTQKNHNNSNHYDTKKEFDCNNDFEEEFPSFETNLDLIPETKHSKTKIIKTKKTK